MNPSDDPAEPRSPFEALCLPAFARAASAAALFELKTRIVLDREPETQAHALKDLSPAMEKLIEVFGEHLEEEEQALLRACVVLRNKLFHMELSRVTGKLRSLGEHLTESGVWMGDLETGEAVAVAETSTRTGRIVGWLLESTGSGAFAAAANAFNEARRVLGALLERMDIKNAARDASEEREPILPKLEKAIEAMRAGKQRK